MDTLNKAIEAKRGNKELAIFYDPDFGWSIEMGNPCSMVRLGESVGEITTGDHVTLEGAALELLQALTEAHLATPVKSG